MPISRRDVEIRNQAHLMDAEGMHDAKPTEAEINALLNKEGYEGYDIEIWFDKVMQIWTWAASIKKVQK